MSQIALNLETAREPSHEAASERALKPSFMPQGDAQPAGFDATGFEIGWDFAHHRLVPPADHLHGTHPVRQGWEAGRSAFGVRTLKPTRAVRQWLDLRLQAWLRGLAFEEVMVTPRFLAQIEVLQCPVTRELLTHGQEAPSDAVIVRLNAQAGVAAGNLAVLSRRAVQARGQCTAGEAECIASRVAAGEFSAPGGLNAAQWLRLASLLRLAEPLTHAQVATLPLRVLPPNRLRLLNPVQALQAQLTLLFAGEAYARRMTALGTLMPNADARRTYHLFMNAMLSRRLAVGWSADRTRVRTALEDAWAHPVIQRRWEQLALRLSRADCERIVPLTAERQLGGTACRWLSDEAATEGWALASHGQAERAQATRETPPRATAALLHAAGAPLAGPVARRSSAGSNRVRALQSAKS